MMSTGHDTRSMLTKTDLLNPSKYSVLAIEIQEELDIWFMSDNKIVIKQQIKKYIRIL